MKRFAGICLILMAVALVSWVTYAITTNHVILETRSPLKPIFISAILLGYGVSFLLRPKEKSELST